MTNVTKATHSTRTAAGERWRTQLDAARGQAMRLGDPNWTPPTDPYAERVDSFRAGQRTDDALVAFLAGRAGPSSTVLEIGAGAGRLSLPLARFVHDVVALEPNAAMADTLVSDAAAARIANVRVLPKRWEALDNLVVDAAFAAHVVYSLPRIEDFLLRLQRTARAWCAVVLFAEPPQSRLLSFWAAVFGEPRQPNPHLPQLLDVLWSLGVYPDVSMLEVPSWPLGPASRARNGLRRRLRVVPGSAADERLSEAMAELLTDWGEAQLGPRNRAPLKLAIVHWTPERAYP